MTEYQRYLAEEIAEDHSDGLVSRREALRRLGLLGLTGAAAASLLAGAVAAEAKALARGTSARVSALDRAGVVAALPTREITFRGRSTCCPQKAAPSPSRTSSRRWRHSAQSRHRDSWPT